MRDTGAGERDLIAIELLDYHDAVATVICETALPPGSRVRLLLPAASMAPPLPGKISGLRRSNDGLVVVTVRLHSLTKDQRAALSLAAVSAGRPTGG